MTIRSRFNKMIDKFIYQFIEMLKTVKFEDNLES